MKLLLLAFNIYKIVGQRLSSQLSETSSPTPSNLPTHTPFTNPIILLTYTSSNVPTPNMHIAKPTYTPTAKPINKDLTPTNKQTCQPPTSLETLPSGCQSNTNMYNSYIQNQPALLVNQTQIIFDNLANESPRQINDVIRQAGVLTLSSLSQTPFQTETTTFNFYAQQIQPLKSQEVSIQSFKMFLPQLNESNVALSVISWAANPYSSNQTIHTGVVSISLSNLTGSLLDTKSLANPIQLSWNINTNYASNYNITCTNSSSINCPNSNMIYNCSQNVTIVCSNPTYHATCLYWNTSLADWDSYGCYQVHANTTYISCNCTHLTDFSARLNAVYESNVMIFNSAPSVYSLAGLEKYVRFYIIFGSFGLLGFLSIAIGHMIDMNDTRKYNVLLNNLSRPQQEEGSVNPKQTLWAIIWNRIIFQHSQISAFMRFDPSLSRVFRLLFVFVGLFNSLFITGFLFNYSSDFIGTMTLLDSFLLSLLTVLLNYPSLVLLSKFIKIAGLAEFQFRYPHLIDELSRRHNFENELIMLSVEELDNIDFDKIERKNFAEDSVFSTMLVSIYTYFNDYISIFAYNKKADVKKTGSLEKAYYFATKTTMIRPPSAINNYLPFHTQIGGTVFFISLGWFIWCLNYLLLFSANHSANVSDSILISFGFSELQTVFLIQPLTITLMIFVNYLIIKVKSRFLKQKTITIPSLYYFADPFIKSYSTSFSTQFAFDIFINIPANISHTGNHVLPKVKTLSYSSAECIVEYLENGDVKYKASLKEEKIKQIYERLSQPNSVTLRYLQVDSQ